MSDIDDLEFNWGADKNGRSGNRTGQIRAMKRIAGRLKGRKVGWRHALASGKRASERRIKQASKK